MSSTYTRSFATTFTISDAEYIASKVETDLMRIHRYYYQTHNNPSVRLIKDFYKELVLLQIFDLLDEIEYGFQANGWWIKALKYTARQGGVLTSDDDPGGIGYSQIPVHAEFASFLRYNHRWTLAPADRQQFLMETPVEREAGDGYSGHWSQNRAYSSGGRGYIRSDI